MKKILYPVSLLLVVVVAFVISAHVNTTELDYSKVVSPQDNVFGVGYHLDMGTNISDMNVVNDLYDYIALVKVKSIDKVSNVVEGTNDPSMVYSKGTLEVLKTLKGNIAEKEITFKRTGGSMPWTEWIKGVDDPEKLINMAKESGVDHTNTIVDARVEGDITIEEGETYLVFMSKHDDTYTIGAFQYGTREVQEPDALLNSTQSVQTLKVKDNVTNKWVPISEVVDFSKLGQVTE